MLEIKTSVPERRVREDHFDVVIVGGGMAGLCAALASARNGAKTCLVHERPVLGGNASSEIRIHICGASENMQKPDFEETGILYELMLENKSRNPYFNYSVWDMTLYQAAINEPNLTLHLNTTMMGCKTEENTIKYIICYQMTSELYYHLSAKVFVDSTGRGTLGYFCGAEYREGSEGKAEFNEPHAPEEPNNYRMGNTLLLKAVDRGHPVSFEPPAFAKKLTEEQLRYRIHSNRHKPIDASSSGDAEGFLRLSTLSSQAVDYGYWWVELMGETDDFISEYEDIKNDLLAYMYGVWDHIKNGGDHGAENYDLEWMGMMPGMREGRRLIGDYILTENDVLQNRRFEDAVAYSGWAVDNHCPHGLLDFDRLPSEVYTYPGVYEIPYRCYYSKNIENLMFAGKIVSASKLGMASLRVMGTCSIGGQAVGTAAAMCVSKACMPRDILMHMNELQQRLLRDDAYIPSVINQDENDLARNAIVTASSYAEDGHPQQVTNGVARKMNGCLNAWKSQTMTADPEWICCALEKEQPVSQVQIAFESDFRYPIRITLSDNRRKQQRKGIPAELVRDYSVELLLHGNVVAQQNISNNHQRMNRICFENVLCDAVRVTVHATNGVPYAHINEIRIY